MTTTVTIFLPSSFEHVLVLAACCLSIFTIRRLNLKSRGPGTLLGRYNSSDICIYYQAWIHAICNVTLFILSIPIIHDLFPCYLLKWVFLYSIPITLLSHVASMLDCAVRTNDTPFYEQFHSISPYTYMLIIVLCTWVPLFTAMVASNQFPHSEVDPNTCLVQPPSTNFHFYMFRASLVFGFWALQLYTIINILVRNRNIRNSTVKELNRISLARLSFLFVLLFALLMYSNRNPAFDWKYTEKIALRFTFLYTFGDMLVLILLPHRYCVVDKIFIKICTTLKIWSNICVSFDIHIVC